MGVEEIRILDLVWCEKKNTQPARHIYISHAFCESIHVSNRNGSVEFSHIPVNLATPRKVMPSKKYKIR